MNYTNNELHKSMYYTYSIYSIIYESHNSMYYTIHKSHNSMYYTIRKSHIFHLLHNLWISRSPCNTQFMNLTIPCITQSMNLTHSIYHIIHDIIQSMNI